MRAGKPNALALELGTVGRGACSFRRPAARRQVFCVHRVSGGPRRVRRGGREPLRTSGPLAVAGGSAARYRGCPWQREAAFGLSAQTGWVSGVPGRRCLRRGWRDGGRRCEVQELESVAADIYQLLVHTSAFQGGSASSSILTTSTRRYRWGRPLPVRTRGFLHSTCETWALASHEWRSPSALTRRPAQLQRGERALPVLREG